MTKVNNHNVKYYNYEDVSNRTQSSAKLHTAFSRGCDGKCGIGFRAIKFAARALALGRYVTLLKLYCYEKEPIIDYVSSTICCLPKGGNRCIINGG